MVGSDFLEAMAWATTADVAKTMSLGGLFGTLEKTGSQSSFRIRLPLNKSFTCVSSSESWSASKA